MCKDKCLFVGVSALLVRCFVNDITPMHLFEQAALDLRPTRATVNTREKNMTTI